MNFNLDINNLLKIKNFVKTQRSEKPIDIIFLTFNRLNYFVQTITALINNTRYPYNIIIVDNNSDEETKNFIKKNELLFDKVIYNNFNEWTSGFQKGIEVSGSDPFVVSDPDILVPNLEGKCWLEQVIELHNTYQDIGLLALNLDDANKPIQMPDVYLGDKEIYNKYITLGNVGTVFQAIKRKYFNFNYVTDWETCARIRNNGGKVGFVNHIKAYHLGWNEEVDYPDYILDKYTYFKEKYGVDTYLYYLSDKNLISKISEKANSYFNNSRPDVQEYVNPNSKKILDVGCASGFLGYALKIKNKAEVWGVEINKDAAYKAMHKIDKVINKPIEAALDDLPNNYFDTIICADVLEHLVEPEAVLLKLKEKLKLSGEFIISLPNVMHYSVVLNLLNGSFDYTEAGILDKTHLRFFTYKSINEMLHRCGLKELVRQNSILDEQFEYPHNFLQALKNMGINEKRFNEESKVFQYILKVVKKEKKLVTIIIPFVNQSESTLVTVHSILKNCTENVEIVLVDDGSTEEELERIQNDLAEYDNIKLIKNNYEHGFASAINTGILEAESDYIILANNDIIVTPGAVERYIELANNKEVGIIGCMSNNASGYQQVEKANYNDIESMYDFASNFSKENKNKILKYPRVAFFFTLIKKEVFNKIGGLDERFNPGNFEDDDFCLRSNLADYKTIIAVDVFIHHYGSQSFRKNGFDKYKELLEKNKQKFIDKWGAEPDKIWENNSVIKVRNIVYPINKDKGLEYLNKALIDIEQNELNLAIFNLQNLLNYCAKNGINKINDITIEEINKLSESIKKQIGNK
jgi:GT2 family glycosyltransferase/ubiquinone/menaquinone biosynthesis C-methylase UbiE